MDSFDFIGFSVSIGSRVDDKISILYKVEEGSFVFEGLDGNVGIFCDVMLFWTCL